MTVAGRVGGLARYLVGVLILALVYYGAARLGLRYASIGQNISLVWPPTGIAFAALVLLGLRFWPGVALGAFLANAATAVPLTAAAGIALGNTLEAITAAWLLSRLTGPRPNLEDTRTIRRLILIAAPLGCILSAGVGVTTLRLAGGMSPDLVPTALAVWWLGDFLGALVVAPLLLSWGVSHQSSRSARGILEILALCVGTAVAVEIGLGRFLSLPTLGQVDYPFLLFPFVIWAAIRFGARGVTLLTFVLSVVAVWHTVHGAGPFISSTPVATLFAITTYLSLVAMTGLVLAAAVTHERDRAARALDLSREQLRRALDAARMGTWMWSVADNSLTWDPNLRQLYGLRPDERISSYQDFLARVHPNDRPFVAEAVRHSAELGDDLNYEFRITLPDGSVRWIADQGHVVRDGEGNPLFMTGVCMDVTERRISEERLRLAHRMESVGRLAGGVAHETNNQMSVVLGASRFVLMRADLPQPVRSDVELIQRAAERTATVTAQLLAFSRRQIMHREVIDLNQVIQNWEHLLRRIMGEDCVVTLSLGNEAGRIKADPGQLQQALLNLVINARDAMPAGGSLAIETFTTRLTQEYARRKPDVTIQPGSYVVLAVSDTGHGMDRGTMGQIFEPFFTTKEVGRGTGLGLSTVYGIVKQSDGYVWAYSEPGKGSTFKLYFPATTETAGTPVVAPETSHRGNGERLLVVEDEDGVRQVVARALRESGYDVLEAESGEQALELFTNQPGTIDLLLTDVVMPGMHGNDLARRLTTLAPGLPVIYMSGYTDGEITRRGLLDPGAAFIQKPFSPEVILKAVAVHLSATARSTDSIR